MEIVEDWASMAACKGGDPDALFVRSAEQNIAKRVCGGCPVRYECLADALDNRIEFGVWGGMTERERRALLRKRPNVSSWREVFKAAMAGEGGADQRNRVPQAVGAAAVLPVMPTQRTEELPAPIRAGQ